MYFDNVRANPQYFYLLNFMVARHRLTHKVWRHLAFVWDAEDDSITVYLDGELGVKAPWGSKVSEMDCVLAGASGKTVALGHDFTTPYGIPDHCCVTYPSVRPFFSFLTGKICAEAEIYDFRMYVGEPLAGDKIRIIANAPTPAFDDLFKCSPLRSEQTRDESWVNGFGQNCQWLFDNKRQYPGVLPLIEIWWSHVSVGEKLSCRPLFDL